MFPEHQARQGRRFWLITAGVATCIALVTGLVLLPLASVQIQSTRHVQWRADLPDGPVLTVTDGTEQQGYLIHRDRLDRSATGVTAIDLSTGSQTWSVTGVTADLVEDGSVVTVGAEHTDRVTYVTPDGEEAWSHDLQAGQLGDSWYARVVAASHEHAVVRLCPFPESRSHHEACEFVGIDSDGSQRWRRVEGATVRLSSTEQAGVVPAPGTYRSGATLPTDAVVIIGDAADDGVTVLSPETGDTMLQAEPGDLPDAPDWQLRDDRLIIAGGDCSAVLYRLPEGNRQSFDADCSDSKAALQLASNPRESSPVTFALTAGTDRQLYTLDPRTAQVNTVTDNEFGSATTTPIAHTAGALHSAVHHYTTDGMTISLRGQQISAHSAVGGSTEWQTDAEGGQALAADAGHGLVAVVSAAVPFSLFPASTDETTPTGSVEGPVWVSVLDAKTGAVLAATLVPDCLSAPTGYGATDDPVQIVANNRVLLRTATGHTTMLSVPGIPEH